MVDPKDLNDDGNVIFENLGILQKSKNKNEYAQFACELWGKLKLSDQLIKEETNKNKIKTCHIKAILVKTIKVSVIVLSKHKNEDSVKSAAFQDLALIMFDLLDYSYYSGCSLDSLYISYNKRCKLYLTKNNYAESELGSPNISQWCRRIRSTIADYLSKLAKSDIKTFLKEALKEYTFISKKGERILRLQEPSLTLQNFPSLAQAEPTGSYENHKIPVGTMIMNDDSVQKYYRITPITASQYEEHVREKNNEKEYTPTSLDENAEILPFIKPDSEPQKDNFSLFWKRIGSVLAALSTAMSLFRPSCQSLFHTNQLSAVGYNSVYNVENPDFALETKIRTGWKKEKDLKIGDTVEVQLNYKNTSSTDQMDVALDCKLPECLELIPGSTRIMNGANPNGATFENDDIYKNGIWIGSYGAGANALIRFKTTFRGGYYDKNDLNVVGRVTVNSETVQDHVNLTAYM